MKRTNEEKDGEQSLQHGNKKQSSDSVAINAKISNFDITKEQGEYWGTIKLTDIACIFCWRSDNIALLINNPLYNEPLPPFFIIQPMTIR